jgi:hypothetical protein
MIQPSQVGHINPASDGSDTLGVSACAALHHRPEGICAYTHKRIEVIIIRRRRRHTPKIGTWLDMVGYVEHA